MFDGAFEFEDFVEASDLSCCLGFTEFPQSLLLGTLCFCLPRTSFPFIEDASVDF